MTTAMHRWRAFASHGAFTSGLALLLATLSVLAGTVTPTAAQSLTRGPVLIETHHTDLAGNIRLSTNEAGDVTQRLDYAPFGEVDGRSCTGDGDPTRSPQFQGKLRDPKTCLDDFGARDYYMVTGRFQSVDPVLPVETALRDPQQWNRYAYARNNPLIYTDPDGRHPVAIAVAVAAYTVFEYLSTAYDVYQAGRTLADPNATAGDKLLASGQVAAGVGLPGPGALWGKAARKVDDVVDAAKVVENGASSARTIRNGHLAGSAHPVTGIPFDAAGYPDFSGVAKTQVTIKQTGSRKGDFQAANKAAGYGTTPAGYTWHHHQDGKTMQLVPREVHAKTGHTGGFETK